MTVTDMDHVIMVLVWFMVSVIKEFFKVCMLFVGFLFCIHMTYTIVEVYLL